MAGREGLERLGVVGGEPRYGGWGAWGWLGWLFIGEFKASEGKSRVMQKIGYLGDSGLSKREILWVGWPGSCLAV